MQLNLPCLDPLCHLHDEVGVVSLIIVSSDKVEESNKSKRKVFGLRVLQTLQDDLHDRNEVLLQRSPALHV